MKKIGKKSQNYPLIYGQLRKPTLVGTGAGTVLLPIRNRNRNSNTSLSTCAYKGQKFDFSQYLTMHITLIP